MPSQEELKAELQQRATDLARPGAADASAIDHDRLRIVADTPAKALDIARQFAERFPVWQVSAVSSQGGPQFTLWLTVHKGEA
ncbi:hypothetical protein GCM10009665_33490 [Kitasatospora nipponensis]|uniref:Uncharacterized protein n=1 Tax=Kitasatospora nipponensis TaxID=258049 RepID=A0ABN1WC94_9ACTN